MPIFEILKKLEDAGELTVLIKSGVVKPQTRLFIQIYEYHKKQSARRFTTKGGAVAETMDRFKCSQRTVYNAINFCKQ